MAFVYASRRTGVEAVCGCGIAVHLDLRMELKERRRDLGGDLSVQRSRDGCGLLDVNSYPGLAEFNALSGELNTLVEKSVLPTLREKASVGAAVHFVGCAEAPESAADADEPLLTIIPVRAEVR